MIARRAAALAAYSTLLFSLIRAAASADLAGRAALLDRALSLPLAERRAEGAAASYDRGFFRFLTEARKHIPLDARGVALYAPGIPEWGGLYLAVYELAPLPVALAPSRTPAGWVALAYRTVGPAGARVLRRLPDGVMLAP